MSATDNSQPTVTSSPELVGDSINYFSKKSKTYFSREEIQQFLKFHNNESSRGSTSNSSNNIIDSNSKNNKNNAIATNKDIAIRSQWIDFINTVGRKLGFPQSTICTAQVLYNRFFLFHSTKEYPPSDISSACLFAAMKFEETHKKLKDIVAAVQSIRYPNSSEPNDQLVEEQRKKMVGYERLILESICFDFKVQDPYKYIIKFTKKLGGQKVIAEKAWKICNESYKTTMCLRFPPHTIAASSIYLAAHFLDKKDFLFSANINDQPWYKICLSRIEDIEVVLLSSLLDSSSNGYETVRYIFTPDSSDTSLLSPSISIPLSSPSMSPRAPLLSPNDFY
ncbi:7542_t:CDS:2 [Ambispora leptoticha]|uniref:7542_t:CDS:1 n=1 Tax=Ambispora leptoticha TaxID=144679 RepID=A0A9N9A0D7_9GLOM|nr:7542_t:CDS:2 [Ambispora leptoticha]